MGYGAEKEKVEKKIRKIWRVLFIVLCVVLVALAVFSCFCPMETWKFYVSKPNVSKRQEGELRIHFLDVGQGDATIIELSDGKIMLIDGGNGDEDTLKAVMRYLNALKIEAIDYLVVTHADEDHCGSLDKVLKYKDVKQAFVPVSSVTDENEYGEFFAALLKEGCSWSFSSPAIDLSVAGEQGYTLKFLYPYIYDVEQETEIDTNDSSCVLWLDYQGTSAIFMGDAPLKIEQNLMRDFWLGLMQEGIVLNDTEILKVSHHGSRDATSAEFVKFLGVKDAVISCGENNPYKHPSDTVLENLEKSQVSVYRTDTQGNVIFTISKTGEYEVKTLQ